MTFNINGKPITFHQLKDIYQSDYKLTIGAVAAERINRCRNFLEEKLSEQDAQYYGINTGFGSLCNVTISSSAIEDLQLNLIRSHAVGLGDPLPKELCKLILLLKILNMSWGHSGVRLKLVEKLCELYNHDVIPVMYKFGSLGASGDLAPLSHLSLPLVGEGEVYDNGGIIAADKILSQKGIETITLKAKEGLALINGTQFTTGITAWCLMQSFDQWRAANLTAAVANDVFDCRNSPFDEKLYRARPHEGHRQTAAQIRAWRAGSELAAQPKKHVQDPYAFRCVPQVHGASFQAMEHAKEVLTTEINSVTDNPIIFPEDEVSTADIESGAQIDPADSLSMYTDRIISGGNFHAQPIALIADYLAIANAELASISERRLYQLVSGPRDLPDYLIEDAGINSGFMIMQYTAASIVNRNKILCTPASVDSIVSSKGQEDHVSMGANGATKLFEIVQNTWDILAMEWLAVTQAIDLCRPVAAGPQVMKLHGSFRQRVPMLTSDRVLRPDILKSKAFLMSIHLPA